MLLLPETSTQGFGFLVFFFLGAIIYTIYEIVRVFWFSKKFLVFKHIIDGLFVLFAAFIFITVTEHIYGGLLAFHTFFSFILGAFFIRFLFRKLLRKFLYKLINWYKAKFSKHTNHEPKPNEVEVKGEKLKNE